MVNSSRHVNNQSDVISMGFAYQYDQLNRIRNMVTYEGLDNNTWSSADSPTASSSYTYDKNGNLTKLNRSNRNNAPFDVFTYNPVDGVNNNKLLSVTDSHNDALTESTDIDGTAGPYTYDQIGNLISDPSNGIPSNGISWNASGKVKSVTRSVGSEMIDLHFKYDPTGNRIVKMVENPENNSTSLAFYTKTYYLRDAQGNIMATYERKYLSTDPDVLMTFSLTERSVYGSSRIANFSEPILLVSFDETTDSDYVHYGSPQILSHTNGYKHFELTNHLGNVMAVVSDKRTPIITGSTITGYTPELLIAKDYYPFGMEMSGRYGGTNGTEPDDEYRFGFNGQEKDDEITGQTGSVYTAMFWEYDARIGRRWNLDPVYKPWMSSYHAFSNNPVARIDPLGDDDYFSSTGKFLYRDNKTTDFIRIIPQEKVNELLIKYQEDIHCIGKIVVCIPRSVQSEFSQSSVAMSEYRWGTNISKGKEAVAKIGKFYARSTNGYDGTENIIGQRANGSIMSSGRDDYALKKHIGISIAGPPTTTSGHTSRELDNVGNFKSVLAHEKFHYENHVRWDVSSNMYLYDYRPEYVTELEAHYYQVRHQTWEGTTDDFRAAEIGKIQGHYNQVTDPAERKKLKEDFGKEGIQLK